MNTVNELVKEWKKIKITSERIRKEAEQVRIIEEDIIERLAVASTAKTGTRRSITLRPNQDTGHHC